MIDSDGSNELQLTTSLAYDGHPAWSPDRTKIVFVSNRTGNRDIWMMDSDGGNKKQLTIDRACDWLPAWSPDGKKIAFVSDRSDDLNLWRHYGVGFYKFKSVPMTDYITK